MADPNGSILQSCISQNVLYTKTYYITKLYKDHAPCQEQELTRSLYTAWYFLMVENAGTKEATKVYSVPEKQLMNTCPLLVLAPYRLCKFSKPHRPSKSMIMAIIQLPV